MTKVSLHCYMQGLDTNKFILGSICSEELKTQSFNKKKDLWTHLMALAEQHKKKGKCLVIYSPNMRRDWYTIRSMPEPRNAVHYSNEPFIVDFEDEEHRIYCKFTSTTSLWRGTLKSLGEAIGHKKGNTPEWLKRDEYEPSCQELMEAAAYNRQDTVVLMQYLLDLKTKLRAVNMNPRWILTAAQVAISYFLNEASRAENATDFFKDKMRKVLFQTNYPRHLWAACRGGRTQAFATGTHEGVDYLDINSAFSYHLAILKMPNLKSERFIHTPLTNGWTKEEILSNIGVSCCQFLTIDHPYGVLSIRPAEDYAYWPRRAGQIIRGVWTHQEIAYALKEGYLLQTIEWSVIYTETANPFTHIVERLYAMKRDAVTESDRAFAKMLLNGAIGKFSQIREQNVYEWDSVKNHAWRVQDKWVPIEQDGCERLYKKCFGSNYPRWYAPIINALVRADAQLRLLEHLKLFDPKEVLYCDTDSILVSDGKANIKIKYSTQLGGFKLVGTNLTLTVWGKKAYALGDELKLSGAGNITATDLATGLVTARKMLSDHDTADKSKVGTFTTVEHDLNKLLAEQTAKEQQYSQEPYLVDERLLRLELESANL